MRSRNGQTTVKSCKMIDALMYGMMPSAKIVICERLFPENMSYSPNMVPRACSASWLQRREVHTRNRDVTADAIHDEHAQA